MGKRTTETYDFICFSDLINEYDSSVQKAIEKKIKRRLKYHGLGEYDQARVDYIRQLKEELAAEIKLQRNSQYFKKTDSIYAEMQDFDIKQMNLDYAKKYDKVSKSDLRGIINFAVHWFHTR